MLLLLLLGGGASLMQPSTSAMRSSHRLRMSLFGPDVRCDNNLCWALRNAKPDAVANLMPQQLHDQIELLKAQLDCAKATQAGLPLPDLPTIRLSSSPDTVTWALSAAKPDAYRELNPSQLQDLIDLLSQQLDLLMAAINGKITPGAQLSASFLASGIGMVDMAMAAEVQMPPSAADVVARAPRVADMAMAAETQTPPAYEPAADVVARAQQLADTVMAVETQTPPAYEPAADVVARAQQLADTVMAAETQTPPAYEPAVDVVARVQGMLANAMAASQEATEQAAGKMMAAASSLEGPRVAAAAVAVPAAVAVEKATDVVARVQAMLAGSGLTANLPDDGTSAKVTQMAAESVAKSVAESTEAIPPFSVPVLESAADVVARAQAMLEHAKAPIAAEPATTAEILAPPSMTEAPSSVADALSSMTEAPSSVADALSSMTEAPRSVADALSSMTETPSSVVDALPEQIMAAAKALTEAQMDPAGVVRTLDSAPVDSNEALLAWAVPLVQEAAQTAAKAVSEAAALLGTALQDTVLPAVSAEAAAAAEATLRVAAQAQAELQGTVLPALQLAAQANAELSGRAVAGLAAQLATSIAAVLQAASVAVDHAISGSGQVELTASSLAALAVLSLVVKSAADWLASPISDREAYQDEAWRSRSSWGVEQQQGAIPGMPGSAFEVPDMVGRVQPTGEQWIAPRSPDTRSAQAGTSRRMPPGEPSAGYGATGGGMVAPATAEPARMAPEQAATNYGMTGGDTRLASEARSTASGLPTTEQAAAASIIASPEPVGRAAAMPARRKANVQRSGMTPYVPAPLDANTVFAAGFTRPSGAPRDMGPEPAVVSSVSQGTSRLSVARRVRASRALAAPPGARLSAGLSARDATARAAARAAAQSTLVGALSQ